MSRLRTLKHRRPAEVSRESVFRTDLAEPGTEREVADWSDLADDRLMRSEMRTRLVSALSALPDIYRAPCSCEMCRVCRPRRPAVCSGSSHKR